MVYKTALTWKALKDIFSPELAFENYKKKKMSNIFTSFFLLLSKKEV